MKPSKSPPKIRSSKPHHSLSSITTCKTPPTQTLDIPLSSSIAIRSEITTNKKGRNQWEHRPEIETWENDRGEEQEVRSKTKTTNRTLYLTHQPHTQSHPPLKLYHRAPVSTPSLSTSCTQKKQKPIEKAIARNDLHGKLLSTPWCPKPPAITKKNRFPFSSPKTEPQHLQRSFETEPPPHFRIKIEAISELI